jgi:hypothetical protein
MAGGDYWTTNYPQPTVLSSSGIACTSMQRCYSVLDASGAGAAFEVWQGAAAIEVLRAAHPAALVGRCRPASAASRAARTGRPAAPSSASRTAINSFDRLDRMIDAGVAVSGLWCEDWAGIRRPASAAACSGTGSGTARAIPTCRGGSSSCTGAASAFWPMPTPISRWTAPLFAEAAAGGHLALARTRRALRGRLRRVRRGRGRLHPRGKRRLVRRADPRARDARHRHRRLDGRLRRISADRRPAGQRRKPDDRAQSLAGAVGGGECAGAQEPRRWGDALFFMRAGFSACRRIAPCCGPATSRSTSRATTGSTR